MRGQIEPLFTSQVEEFTAHAAFRRLESGEALPDEYDRFIANVIRTHARSPQVVAFLYAMAPPSRANELLANLLEEAGVGGDESHPAMLRALATGAGLEGVLPQLEALAEEDLRKLASDPVMYDTLREIGLAGLCEVVAVEFMLSRVAGRMAAALAVHRGLSPDALVWFTQHAEVDVAHAEEGFEHIAAFAGYHGLADRAQAIIEAVLRENLFVQRYLTRATPIGAA
jgi:pyrroloquinoline quinone (PQQ) biosynthesis protein C